MGSPIDLTLGCTGSSAPEASSQEYLWSLEEERRKLDGFKRELPICIQLLEDAIQASKEKLARVPTLQLLCNDGSESREECLPLKRRWRAVHQFEGGDGRSAHPEPHLRIHDSTSAQEKEKEQEHERSAGGAFVPFLREHPDPVVSRPTPTMAHSGTRLSLAFGDLITNPNASAAGSVPEAGHGDAGLQTQAAMASNGASSKSHRKARRCWSPELHQRFIGALGQLGGAEVATPKQICELMKVDGLTNDEVKSHLQKYRLHTRRPTSSSPQPAAAPTPPPQLVVLGGIWLPPKCTSSPSQPSDSAPGHHPQPPQFSQATQDHYFACLSNRASGAPVPQPPSFEPSQSQGSLHVPSQLSEATQGPNSEVYHDESGEEEEAKSDSTSWKNDEELKKKPSLECTST